MIAGFRAFNLKDSTGIVKVSAAIMGKYNLMHVLVQHEA